MRRLLLVMGLLIFGAPAAWAQYPPNESATVVAVAGSTGDLIKTDSTAFTDTVCSALARKDPNWGRKVRRAGDWSSRNADALAYRFGSDENKALVDIVVASDSAQATPAWQVFPGPNTGNGYWMKCYDGPRMSRFGNDFDGDGMQDLGVFRPSNGTWYLISSSTRSPSMTAWGVNGDVPVPGDYDGDGRTDVAVYRPSEGVWYVICSSNGARVQMLWGMAGDVPVPGDYDGDGKADLCVWRPSNGRWYWLKSSDHYSWGSYQSVEWGRSGDIPARGDYDGDGKADLCVWRPSEGRWYWLQSTANYSWAAYRQVQWGVQALGDQIVPADYDGDGKTDLAVWRPGEGRWYWLKSSDNYSWSTYQSRQWGLLNDVPAPADYDGDGKADLVVFRPSNGTWYGIVSGTGGVVSYVWGLAGDKPL